MPVARSSRDALGDCPRGRRQPPPPAGHAAYGRDVAPSKLPPPPATIPTNFRPAYLGTATTRPALDFESGSGLVNAGLLARPARRASATATRSTPTLRSPPAFVNTVHEPARRRVASGLVLDAPPESVCRGVNAALASWRMSGCPSVAPRRAGILRHRPAINARATSRPRKTVSFSIPAPCIQLNPASPTPRLHPGSLHLAAATTTPRTSRPSSPVEDGWTLVTSRLAQSEARLSARRDGPHLCLRQTQYRPRHHLNAPPPNHSSSSSRFAQVSPPRNSSLRCRRCDAREHITSACRDPVKCDSCGRSGHWARDCNPHRLPAPAKPKATPSTTSRPTASSSAVRSSTAPLRPRAPRLATDMNFRSLEMVGDSATRGMDYLGAPATRPEVDLCVMAPSLSSPPACGRASSPRLRSVITGSLNLEASAPADRVAPALGSVPRHLLLNVVVAPPPFASLLDPVAAPAPALGPPARRLISSKIKPAGRRSASPTQARHAQSASTSSTSSDLALSNQDHAHPAMDVCFYTLPSRVLANERCYKTSVDDVLSAENERTDLGLLQMQGKVGDRKTAESEVLLCLSTAATGEVVPEVSRPALECSPLMSSSHPVLSPDAGLTVLPSPGNAPCEGGHPSVDVESVDGLTMVFISPGDALCDGGFSSEDDEDEEMEELLPCLADQDQQELLLDGEEVGVWARREFQPVADVLDADAEAATIGNLLDAEADDDSDDDDVVDATGTTPSSGIVIRSVADLFSLPVVSLLPTPIPRMPHADAALPAPGRRSSRLAMKPQLSAVGKAKRVLHKKMGLDFGDMPLVEATKEFMNTCKKAPFSDSAISGVRTLLRLNLPSMTAADEALIGLAGPGGSDFPPLSALDVSA